MKILLSNDDGYQAPGIVALYDAIRDLGEVEVVAPEHNNSAKSNALTLHAPLYVTEAASGFKYVNGTPADCVHVQRRMQRERVRLRAVVVLRRDHVHVAEVADGVVQRNDAGRLVAVVVGEQDLHGCRDCRVPSRPGHRAPPPCL